jgi:hypothetical protein
MGGTTTGGGGAWADQAGKGERGAGGAPRPRRRAPCGGRDAREGAAAGRRRPLGWGAAGLGGAPPRAAARRARRASARAPRRRKAPPLPPVASCMRWRAGPNATTTPQPRLSPANQPRARSGPQPRAGRAPPGAGGPMAGAGEYDDLVPLPLRCAAGRGARRARFPAHRDRAPRAAPRAPAAPPRPVAAAASAPPVACSPLCSAAAGANHAPRPVAPSQDRQRARRPAIARRRARRRRRRRQGARRARGGVVRRPRRPGRRGRGHAAGLGAAQPAALAAVRRRLRLGDALRARALPHAARVVRGARAAGGGVRQQRSRERERERRLVCAADG